MKSKIAVISHARKEPFFIRLWAQHYAKHFGSESLFLMKDGDDWELPTDTKIGTVKPISLDQNRTKADEEFAVLSETLATELLQRFDMVLRVDIDEFLCLEPGKYGWDDVVEECTKNGYLYALGFDVIHKTDVEGPLDPSRPILSQRRHASFTGSYCKPHAVAAPIEWTSACHTVKNKPVILSKYLGMFHLASMDKDLTLSRAVERGDTEKRSYAGHLNRKMSQFDTMLKASFFSVDDAEVEMRKKIEFDDLGGRKESPRFRNILGHRTIKVTLPQRFSECI